MRINNIHSANYTAVGACIGVHRTTIMRMVKDQGAPVNDDNSIDIPTFIQWLRERDIDDNAPIDEIGLKYLNLQRRERYKILKMERLQRENKLMSREEIEKAWVKRVQLVTSGLELFANRLAPMLVGKEIKEIHEIIKQEVRELRNSYATRGVYCPTPVEQVDPRKR